MSNLADLQASVAAAKTVEDSAITLLGGLKAALDAAIASAPTDDSSALQALSDSIGTETAALAAAVTANTPAPAGGTTPPPDQTTPGN